MNGREFLRIYGKPNSVDSKKLQEVDALVRRHPYFSSARLLMARLKRHFHRPDASKQYTIASLYATDKQLFRTFMSLQTRTPKTPSKKKTSPKQITQKITPPLTPELPKNAPSSPTHALKTPLPMHPSEHFRSLRTVSASMRDSEREHLLGEVMSEIQTLKGNMSRFTADEDARERRELQDAQFKNRVAAERFDNESHLPPPPPSLAPEKRNDEAIKKEISRLRDRLKKPAKTPPAPPVIHPTPPPPPSPPRNSSLHSSSPVQVIFGTPPPNVGMPYGTQAAAPFSYFPPYPNPTPYHAPPNTSYAAYPPQQAAVYAPAYPPPPYGVAPSAPPYAQPLHAPVFTYPAVAVPQSPAPPFPPPAQQPSAPMPPPAQQPQHPEFVPPTHPQQGTSAAEHDQQQAIIDRFVERYGQEQPVAAAPKERPGSPQPLPSAVGQEEIRDDVCSEELAELYLNQGYKSRAIDMYHRLCEKHPEKSAYFVKKIREIRE